MMDSQTLHNIAAGKVRPAGLVSIVLPHFETAQLDRLCLRAIRRFTDQPFEVLVIDNGSADGASLDYLRSVSWIRLIERPAGTVPPTAPAAHATALNLGLAEARGEFFLAMHTDTIPRGPGWLRKLAAPFAGDDKLAVVGSDKIDEVPPLSALLKKLGDVKALGRRLYHLAGRPAPTRWRANPPHARSFCALYRRQVLQREELDFLPRRMRTAGEELYHELLRRGYRGMLLPPAEMRDLVAHIVHATALLSPRRQINTPRVRRRTERRVQEMLEAPWVRELLADESLDR